MRVRAGRRPPGGLPDVEAFAAAVIHELRSPLAALSGEIELTLRRDRSPAEYREALSRMAEAVAELVELTGDLAVIGKTPGSGPAPRPTALAPVLASVAGRWSAETGVGIDTPADAAALRVMGDPGRLTRAVTRLVEQGVRYREPGAPIQLRMQAEADHVDLVLSSPGFRPAAWSLFRAADGSAPEQETAGLLRLRTAVRILEDCDGSAELVHADGVDAVRIRLRRA